MIEVPLVDPITRPATDQYLVTYSRQMAVQGDNTVHQGFLVDNVSQYLGASCECSTVYELHLSLSLLRPRSRILSIPSVVC